MLGFWLMLFAIKLYSRKDVFKHIKKKHGKDKSDIARSFENLKTKYEKISLDIAFIKSCKKEHLLPMFAEVRLSNKNAIFKLKQRIGRIIMEDEMQRKHLEKKKLRKEIRSASIQLKVCLTILVCSVLLQRIKMVVRSTKKAINLRHQKKLLKLRKDSIIVMKLLTFRKI